MQYNFDDLNYYYFLLSLAVMTVYILSQVNSNKLVLRADNKLPAKGLSIVP